MSGYDYASALEKLTQWSYAEGIEKIILDHNDISYIDWERKSLNFPKLIKIEGKYPKFILCFTSWVIIS